MILPETIFESCLIINANSPASNETSRFFQIKQTQKQNSFHNETND